MAKGCALTIMYCKHALTRCLFTLAHRRSALHSPTARRLLWRHQPDTMRIAFVASLCLAFAVAGSVAAQEQCGEWSAGAAQAQTLGGLVCLRL
jgi:hypothetical protein